MARPRSENTRPSIPLKIFRDMRKPLQIGFLLLVGIFFTANDLVFGEAANANNIASWQDYLSQRPIVYEVVFRRSTPSTRKDGQTSQRVVSYVAAWQPGSFYLEDQSSGNWGSSLTNDSAINVIGMQNLRYWYINYKEITQWQDTGNASDQRNPVWMKCKINELTLLEVLNFGVRLLKNSTLQWSGNKFIASTDESLFFPKDTSKHIGTIRGEIFLNANGFPSSLRFRKDGYRTEQAIYYNYPDMGDLPKFFPNRIVHKAVSTNGTESLISETIIARLSLSSASLPAAHFEPERFISKFQAPPKATVLTNGSYYRVSRGKMTQVLAPPKDGISFAGAQPEVLKATFFLAIIFLATSVLLIYYFVQRERHKTNEQKEKNKL